MPIALGQTIICYLFAIPLGLTLSVNIVYSIIGMIPMAVFNIALGLDVIARHELWETIRSLKGKITIILTTHYMEEAESLSDRIGIMKNGKLLAVGTVSELKAKAYINDFESAFISFVKEGT